MKLELTPEVISLLRILGALLLALISLSGWLIIRLVKATYWIVNEKNRLEVEKAEQAKKWQELAEFRLLVEGNRTPEHPGLISRVVLAETVAKAASADLLAWRSMLGISDSKMEQKKVELIRETLGIYVAQAADIVPEPYEPEDARPALRETATGRHRALTRGDLPPLARPALRKQTPYRTDYHGAPISDDDDTESGSKGGRGGGGGGGRRGER